MKVLFVLHLFSHSRHFHTVFEQLLARGHELKLLAQHHPDRRERPVKTPKHMRHIKSVDYDLIAPPRNDFWGAYANRWRASRNLLFYDHPAMAKATVFRRRAEGFEDPFLRSLRRIDKPMFRRLLERAYTAAEAACPADPVVVEQLEAEEPDVVLVSPLIFNEMLDINEYVKAAHHLGVPVAFPVFSWDNLTTKGTIHTQPDRIFVWNEFQRSEALAYHRATPDQVDVLGAWRFDEFTEFRPRLDYAEFCRRNRFDTNERTILYIGSSPIVAATESDFIDEWAAAIRKSPDASVRRANILIRPHPRNELAWWDSIKAISEPRINIQALDHLSLFETHDLHDALSNCDAVVGLVTSAMIEAAILGKPVHTIITDLAGEGQDGTVHFDYLTEAGGGLLHVAHDLDEHIKSLGSPLNRPRGASDQRACSFLEAFVRPPGSVRPTDRLADAIEKLAQLEKKPVRRTIVDQGAALVLQTCLASGVLPLGRGKTRVNEMQEGRPPGAA